MAIALSAQSQVSVNVGMKATVATNGSATSSLRAKASTTPNASVNALLHANDDSAVIRGNERQDDKDATTTASSTVTSTDDRDSGTPRKMNARFLGIFPASITAHVVADASGKEEVRYPWYAFLFKLAVGADANASVR